MDVRTRAGQSGTVNHVARVARRQKYVLILLPSALHGDQTVLGSFCLLCGIKSRRMQGHTPNAPQLEPSLT